MEIVNPDTQESQGKYSYVYTFKEGYCIIAALPVTEVTVMRDASMLLSTFMQVLIFAVLFLILYFLIKKIITFAFELLKWHTQSLRCVKQMI